LGLAIADELDADHDMAAADLADQRQVAERPEALLEIRPEFAHALAQLLALHDLQVLEAGGAGHRMGGVSEAVGEELALGALAGDALVEPVREQEGAQRNVAGGQ